MDLNGQDTADKLINLEIEAEPYESKLELSEKDQAFLRSGKMELSFGGPKGKELKLNPFDYERKVVGQLMGMNIMNMPEEALEELQARDTYDGLWTDAIVTMYLCAHGMDVIERAFFHPKVYKKRALRWSKEIGVDFGNDKHGEIIDKFIIILKDMFSSAAEVDETGLPDSGQSLGESPEVQQSM